MQRANSKLEDRFGWVKTVIPLEVCNLYVIMLTDEIKKMYKVYPVEL